MITGSGVLRTIDLLGESVSALEASLAECQQVVTGQQAKIEQLVAERDDLQSKLLEAVRRLSER